MKPIAFDFRKNRAQLSLKLVNETKKPASELKKLAKQATDSIATIDHFVGLARSVDINDPEFVPDKTKAAPKDLDTATPSVVLDQATFKEKTGHFDLLTMDALVEVNESNEVVDAKVYGTPYRWDSFRSPGSGRDIRRLVGDPMSFRFNTTADGVKNYQDLTTKSHYQLSADNKTLTVLQSPISEGS